MDYCCDGDSRSLLYCNFVDQKIHQCSIRSIRHSKYVFEVRSTVKCSSVKNMNIIDQDYDK